MVLQKLMSWLERQLLKKCYRTISREVNFEGSSVERRYSRRNGDEKRPGVCDFCCLLLISAHVLSLLYSYCYLHVLPLKGQSYEINFLSVETFCLDELTSKTWTGLGLCYFPTIYNKNLNINSSIQDNDFLVVFKWNVYI